MIKRVVVGVDGSGGSLNAYENGCFIAHLLRIPVLVVFVMDRRRLELPYIYTSTFNDISYEKIFIPPSPEVAGFFKKLKEDTKDYAVKTLEKCRSMQCSDGLIVEEEIAEGIPFEEIADLCTATDLAVIGKYGENKDFHKNVLGSTTEELMRKTKNPVLISNGKIDRIRKVALVDGGGTSEVSLRNFADDISGGNDVFIGNIASFKESVIVSELLNSDYDVVITNFYGRHRFSEHILGSHAVHLVRKCMKGVFIVK